MRKSLSEERGSKHARFVMLSLLFVAALPARVLPQLDHQTVYRNAYDLKNSGLRVLSIALEPGFEDLSALAYFRAERGAEIVSAYVTNGEAGEADDGFEYPRIHAARKREEAYRALEHLEGTVVFLNMPDFGVSNDSLFVRTLWTSDSLRAALGKLISDFLPDIVLLSQDYDASGKGTTVRWEFVKSDLVEEINQAKGKRKTEAWSVSRLLFDNGSGKGLSIPIVSGKLKDSESWAHRLDRAFESYESVKVQKQQWEVRSPRRYQSLEKLPRASGNRPDAGLPKKAPKKFTGIEKSVASASSAVLRGLGTQAIPNTLLQKFLKDISAVSDSVNYHARNLLQQPKLEQRWIGQWKNRLDALKNSLLGVDVRYQFSDTVLCELQLTLLKIDSVYGATPDGTTELYFPFVDKGWVVNEDTRRRVPLVKEPYRILSPKTIEYNVPPQEFGLDDRMYGTPFTFFVAHRAKTLEQSFVKSVHHRLMMSPRFSVEILTPFVKAVDGERLIVRLTNRSRDGVADVVKVQDSMVTSPAYAFRLSGKDLTHVDTLELAWSPALQEGTHVFDVLIGRFPVARFAARKFDVAVDSSKRVAIVSHDTRNFLGESLRRLGLQFSRLEPADIGPGLSGNHDVLILDRRVLTMRPDLVARWSFLERFADEGGHLIVLSQDPAVWETVSTGRHFSIAGPVLLGAASPVHVDSTHPMVQRPNLLAADDWQEWIFQRGYDRIVAGQAPNIVVPISDSGSRIPLVLVEQRDKGTLTYVNLAVHPQLLNIHQGVFKLLANLVSYAGGS